MEILAHAAVDALEQPVDGEHDCHHRHHNRQSAPRQKKERGDYQADDDDNVGNQLQCRLKKAVEQAFQSFDNSAVFIGRMVDVTAVIRFQEHIEKALGKFLLLPAQKFGLY